MPRFIGPRSRRLSVALSRITRMVRARRFRAAVARRPFTRGFPRWGSSAASSYSRRLGSRAFRSVPRRSYRESSRSFLGRSSARRSLMR